jgi:hypothetical protein
LHNPVFRIGPRNDLTLPNISGSGSFLKKRTNKLLPMKGATWLAHLNRRLEKKSKSFLFLFSRKK